MSREQVREENRLFAILHDGLMQYIEHRVEDEERQNDIYEETIDRLIELTE